MSLIDCKSISNSILDCVVRSRLCFQTCFRSTWRRLLFAKQMDFGLFKHTKPNSNTCQVSYHTWNIFRNTNCYPMQMESFIIYYFSSWAAFRKILYIRYPHWSDRHQFTDKYVNSGIADCLIKSYAFHGSYWRKDSLSEYRYFLFCD